jgi:hypothetical protein
MPSDNCCRTSRFPDSARSCASIKARAEARNAKPSAVSRTARGERSTRRFSSTASSRCNFILTAACVVPSASAARVKLCSSATSRNACTVGISSVVIITHSYHCYDLR